MWQTAEDVNGTLQGFSKFSRDLAEPEESGARYRGLLEAAGVFRDFFHALVVRVVANER